MNQRTYFAVDKLLLKINVDKLDLLIYNGHIGFDIPILLNKLEMYIGE